MAAAMNYLFRPSLSSSPITSHFRRSVSSASISETETIKSHIYPRNPLPTQTDPNGRNAQWVSLAAQASEKAHKPAASVPSLVSLASPLATLSARNLLPLVPSLFRKYWIR